MELLLFASVALLSFANGANDNFKGVATLWGAGLASYRGALAWATVFTAMGSVASVWVSAELVRKFNGANYVGGDVLARPEYLTAVVLGGGMTVLLASCLGLPVSTTHALTGALVGAGAAAAEFANVKFSALGAGVALPLVLSPVVSLLLTTMAYPLVRRARAQEQCVCVDAAVVVDASGATIATKTASPALGVRVANPTECETGIEVARVGVSSAMHWLSAAAISFARGLNDTPKIVAVLLVGGAAITHASLAAIALAMAAGGVVAAGRVARTMSKKITPMASDEAVGANLVAASLVTGASLFALPVSTTHVTSGAIFGIGLRRRNEADWACVRHILLSWVGTLPLGAVLATVVYWLLAR